MLSLTYVVILVQFQLSGQASSDPVLDSNNCSTVL